MKCRIHFLQPQELICHEQTDDGRFSRILVSLQKTKTLRKPLIVDSKTHVILDGHHRYWALTQLGVTTIPCYFVSYFDTNIQVGFRRKKERDQIMKAAILARALSGKLFPTRTTYHRLKYRPTINMKITISGGDYEKY